MTSLQDIVASTEAHLGSRPERTPDYQAESAALSRLAEDMADRPDHVLQSLCEQLMVVCGAESAGVSLFDGDADFTWPAVTGAWAPFQGGGMPRLASPCGVVVDRDAPLLFHNVEQQFPAAAAATPRIEEILLAPFRVDGKPQGTVWAIVHSLAKRFDREDLRILTSLARFAAAAYKMTEARRTASEARARTTSLDHELSASEEFKRRILASSADCIKVLDLDARLEFMSEGGMCVMEVEDFGSIGGACWPDFWHGAEHALALEAVEEAKRGGTGRFQGFATTMKGSPRWWDVIVTAINGPDGHPEKLLSISRDVTATKDAEMRLRDLNDTLESQVVERTAERDRMWDTSPDLMLVIGFDGVFRRVNPAWTTLLGYRADELVGHHVNEFVLPDDHEGTVRAYETAAQGRNARIENRYRHKDGTTRWIAWVAAPAGDLTYATGRDVTAERDAAAQLSLNRDIVQSNPNPILAFDLDLKVIGFNQAHVDKFLETQGVISQIGHRFPDNFIPEERPAITTLMQRALTGEVFTSRSMFGDPDHVKLCWDLTYSPLRDGTGAIIGACHHAIDVTAQVQAEQALARSEDALRQAQKMEAVGQLTGGVAHDFNNLLTGIMGNLELLQHRVARGRYDDIDRLVNAAQGAGRRAASLTQRLLAFSRRQTLDPKPTDVNRLITGMEDLLRRTVGPTTEIEVVGAGGLWTAMIDAGQLENALLNLCINARDAMPGGGKITIETANKWLDEHTAKQRELTPGQYLSICVTDTGSGMSPEVIERVFEPFFTTKPLGQGTGLGLSMIYGFARQSGGQVRIYSEVGQGTTMCIYLPRAHGDVADDVAALEPAAREGGRSETVLLVDDEASIRHLVDEVLTELGYTVIGVADGAAGLKVVQSGARIDLLVTDVGLPGGMNGRQVADAARVLRPDLKVLFITGFAENAAVGNGHLDPGMELLTKPFALDDLSAKVATMLDRNS